jgi:hypothetical protein
VKKKVNPIVAVAAIVAAVAIAAVVWVHGLAPEQSHGQRGGITVVIKPRDINKARENAKKAQEKFLNETRRGARERTE